MCVCVCVREREREENADTMARYGQNTLTVPNRKKYKTEKIYLFSLYSEE